MLRIAWFGEKIDQKNILKFVYPPPDYFFVVEKTRKVLRIAWFGEKIDQTNILKFFYPPPRFFFVEKNEKFLELPDTVTTIFIDGRQK